MLFVRLFFFSSFSTSYYLYFSFLVLYVPQRAELGVSFQMAALMIALFIGSWLPYALVASFSIVGLNHLVTPYAAELPVMLAKASAIWNPIVYALKHPRYRLALAEYLPENIKACCYRGLGSDSKTSSTRKTDDIQQQQQPAEPAVQPAADIEHVEIHHQIPDAVAAAGEPGGIDSTDNRDEDVDIMWLIMY